MQGEGQGHEYSQNHSDNHFRHHFSYVGWQPRGATKTTTKARGRFHEGSRQVRDESRHARHGYGPRHARDENGPEYGRRRPSGRERRGQRHEPHASSPDETAH